MLSIVDLLEAGTVTRELAAYLLAAIRNGASFMVGARPGGAGKTTVMGVLLNFVPPDMELYPADGPAAIGRGMRETDQRCVYICHEVSPGDYYAYLWGELLRDYFELSARGHLLATNLHADTLEEAREQICRQNGVPEAAFCRMNLLLFLQVQGRWQDARRQIAEAWESDGKGSHRRIYTKDDPDVVVGRLAGEERWSEARLLLDRIRATKARTIEQVRAVLTG